MVQVLARLGMELGAELTVIRKSACFHVPDCGSSELSALLPALSSTRFTLQLPGLEPSRRSSLLRHQAQHGAYGNRYNYHQVRGIAC